MGVMLGITVAGYGGAAFYVAPLIKWLITAYSLSFSFLVLGVAYLIVIGIAAQILAWPEEGYVPPQPVSVAAKAAAATAVDWKPGEMAGTWQFYCLILLFCLNTQAGLLIIGAWAFMSKSIESWFSLPLDQSLKASLSVAQVYYQSGEADAKRSSKQIGRTVVTSHIPMDGRRKIP